LKIEITNFGAGAADAVVTLGADGGSSGFSQGFYLEGGGFNALNAAGLSDCIVATVQTFSNGSGNTIELNKQPSGKWSVFSHGFSKYHPNMRCWYYSGEFNAITSFLTLKSTETVFLAGWGCQVKLSGLRA
jgi:hypothetical protein